MTGIVDVGGGMRGVYTSGVYDYLLDRSVDIGYCLGVSAGSANLITYVAGQRGRLKRFYLEYAFEKEYMSLGNYFKKGMLFDLDYIYSGITNSTGKDPLDYAAIRRSDKRFLAQTTDAENGTARYYSKDDFGFDDFTLLKASCALPVACRKPIRFKDRLHFDGGIADPIPFQKAFDDGCDRVIVCLTLPLGHQKSTAPAWAVRPVMRAYPHIAELMIRNAALYNQKVAQLRDLEKRGKALILYPKERFGVKTATRDTDGLTKLYNLGYADAQKIERFMAAENRAEQPD